MVLGKQIRKFRKAKGLSQAEVEQRTGLLRIYISKVETGRTVPSLESLEKLAAALEIPLYQLFYEEDETPSPLPGRDIEPGNILIRRADGVVKIIDFGVANLTPRRTLEGEEGDSEKHFKHIRQLLANKRRTSEDAKLAFSTLAKLFAKL